MNQDFHTTRWTVVLEAGKKSTFESRQALETLCSAYWYPLYAYARNRGNDCHRAEDLTQGFFAEFLEKNTVEAADPSRGRFRTFLLTAFKRYAGKERERGQAQKRGGGRLVLSLDFNEGERRYALEPGHPLTPERIFDQRWAVTLLGRVLEQLKDEMNQEGKSELFDHLKQYFIAPSDALPYKKLAEQLDLSEGAVKVAVHRLRSRYRNLLRAEIAHTVDSPDEVDQEIRDLMDALKT